MSDLKRWPFDAAKVPPAFSALIPLVEKWAIVNEDDTWRAITACSLKELHELVDAVLNFPEASFDDWLGGDANYGAINTPEWRAFHCLIAACDYARIQLKWANKPAT